MIKEENKKIIKMSDEILKYFVTKRLDLNDLKILRNDIKFNANQRIFKNDIF